MKHFLVILSLLISSFAFSKGSQGTYTIVGIAFSADSVSLKNLELTVKIGDKTTIIKTNEQGGFKIEVKWSTACPSKISEEEEKELTKKMNPEYIYVTYKGKELKIRNTWERYANSPLKNIMVPHNLHY